MKKARIIAVAKLVLFVVLIVALTTPGWAGDKSSKKAKKAKVPGAHATHIKVTDGTIHPMNTKAIKALQWVIYDDGTREAWAAGTVPNSGAAGNKFVSTWGTFYCDMMSAFVMWTGTGSNLYYSMWTGTTNTGADLTGNAYTSFTGLASSGSGWVQIDGSTAPIGFIGNSAFGFSNTAWLGVYVYSANDVGLDTNGPGSHGFYVDAYTGTGYNEMSWNAMVRARFNGDNVPVELMTFTID